MELHHVRAFVAVAEELHFGRAAIKLHIAQPPLSRAIQQLEDELECKLFDRSTRHVRLTPAGDTFLEPARDILSSVAHAEAVAVTAKKGERGRVRIAFSGASTHLMVGLLAREVRTQHPGIDVQLFSDGYALPVLEKVINREIEIGIGRWNFIPPGISLRPIAEERLMIAISKDHPAAKGDEVDMRDLSDEDFVTLTPFEGAVLGSALRELSAEADFIPRIAQIAPDSWTLISLVGAGIGCTLTVSTVAENIAHSNVRYLPIKGNDRIVKLQMAWREDNLAPVLRNVLEIADRVLPLADGGTPLFGQPDSR